MNRSRTDEGRDVVGTKRLVFVWLFGGVIAWTLQYFNRWLSPSSAEPNLPFQVAIGDVCAVLFYLWKWPEMFARSRIQPRLGDLAVGVTLGYFVTNIVALLLGRTAFDHAWVITNPQRHLTLFCAVLVVPVAEELIYRGAILGSLLERTSIIWAVVITVTAAVLMHDVWWTALPSQILLCMAYLVRGRSLTASISAHMVANALIFAPALLIVFHKT